MKFTFKSNKFILFALFISFLSLCLVGYKLIYASPAMIDEARIKEKTVSFLLNESSQEANDLLNTNTQKNNISEPILKDDKTPIISVLVDGIDASKIPQEFFNLPKEVTFGISANLTKETISFLESKGISFMINMPLEHEDLIKQNEGTLLTNSSEDENAKLLSNFLSNLKEKEGVYSITEEKFTETISESEFLLKKLKEKDLIYLCGKTDKNAIIYQTAEKMSFHILENDMILDEVIDPNLINSNLSKLEEIAIKHGSATAIISAYPLNIEILQNWIPTLEAKGIKILPVKTLYKIIKQKKVLKNQEQTP